MANLVNFSTYGFLDDILALNEDNWRNFFKPIVYDSVQGGLEVTAGTGMTVNVSTGECRCGSIMGISNSQMSLDVNVGDSTYDRIDSIVAQYTYDDPSTLTLAVLEGTPASTPVSPTITKSYNSLWQMELAQILVPANSTLASECTITDKRVIYNSLDSVIDPITSDIESLSTNVLAITSDIESLSTNVANINVTKANQGSVARVFSESVSYALGDCVMYQGTLYKFTQGHNAGAWTGNDVAPTNALNESGGGSSGGYGDEITFNDTNSSMIISNSGHSIESTQSAIAIVASGDTHGAITAGQYVYVKLHYNIFGLANLQEGLYVAKSDIAANAALSTTNLTSISGGGLNNIRVLVVNCGTISSLPTTLTSSNVASIAEVTSDMVVLQSTFGTPSAATSNWTVSTGNATLTISGSIASGSSTTLTLYLMKSR